MERAVELVACNFEIFPSHSAVYESLHPLLHRCTEVRFPYSIGERNNNQFNFDFDSKLKDKLLACGGEVARLDFRQILLRSVTLLFPLVGNWW
jgi:hypothetical protein